MGHYASEMDPNWGRLKPWEERLQAMPDELQVIARKLTSLAGYTSDKDRAMDAVESIDELIKRRIDEALEQRSA